MNFSVPPGNPKNNVLPALYETAECRDCALLNARLHARIERLQPEEIVRRNQYLGGRYENIYARLESVPEMRVVLDLATAHAAYLLRRPKKILSIGWWINIMRPGDITYPHTHDDGDELLSGVYYIHVPAGSGRLLLLDGARRAVLVPRPGRFVFFLPQVLHQVTRHQSRHPRISVGFNVGPAA